jgi:hypothetical protein
MPSNDKQASVRLTDGGTMMNYGIIQAIQDGYDDITLINPSFPTAKPIHNLLDMIDFLVTATGSTQLNDETEAAKLLHNANHEVKLTIYSFTAPIPFATLDFNTAGKNYEKYIKIGADLLKQPTLSIRRVIQS